MFIKSYHSALTVLSDSSLLMSYNTSTLSKVINDVLELDSRINLVVHFGSEVRSLKERERLKLVSLFKSSEVLLKYIYSMGGLDFIESLKEYISDDELSYIDLISNYILNDASHHELLSLLPDDLFMVLDELISSIHSSSFNSNDLKQFLRLFKQQRFFLLNYVEIQNKDYIEFLTKVPSSVSGVRLITSITVPAFVKSLPKYLLKNSVIVTRFVNDEMLNNSERLMYFHYKLPKSEQDQLYAIKRHISQLKKSPSFKIYSNGPLKIITPPLKKAKVYEYTIYGNPVYTLFEY